MAPLDGGWRAVDIKAKCDALLIKSLLRLYTSPEGSTNRKLLSYWLGPFLWHLFPELRLGPHSEQTNCDNRFKPKKVHKAYYELCIDKLKLLMPILHYTEWEYQSVKSIYTLLTQYFPPPTIHAKLDLSGF